MRLTDLILTAIVLWALVLVARREFPGYDRRELAAAPVASASALASPTAAPSPAASPSP